MLQEQQNGLRTAAGFGLLRRGLSHIQQRFMRAGAQQCVFVHVYSLFSRFAKERASGSIVGFGQGDIPDARVVERSIPISRYLLLLIAQRYAINRYLA